MKKLHYLASANSGCGFIENFNSILEPNKTGFCFILKGGPGTGKSTLLKTVAKHFQDESDIEYFHCSSDFSSLDGIRIASKNISIIDGTAPHCKDPNIPNISEKIIDLGAFITDKVKKYDNKINKLLINKKNEYNIAYSYLKAIKSLQEINYNICENCFKNDLSKNYNNFISKLNLSYQNNTGYERKLFLEYFEDGLKSTLNLNNFNTLNLEFDLYSNTEILNKLTAKLKENNYKFISFYDVMLNKINAVYILELDVLIISKPSFDNATIKYNNKIINSLIKKTSKALKTAIKNHKKVEKYYISSMDFYGVSDVTNKLIEKIEKIKWGHMKNTIVLKYGGSSVATPEKIKNIANYLKNLHLEGKKIVVVLSAMGKMTNNLIDLSHQFSSSPNKRDLDFLLSTGEMQTISLMSIYLNEIGISSVALTGCQAGIITNDNHTFAFIKSMKISKVKQYLKQNKIVLVAGFQGKTENGEITTLGRGGSDTTAVALASSLNCECEIYTDVDAVKTVDPNIYKNAKSLNKISYDEMMEMSVNGAKVLEVRSVELAKKFNTPLYLGKCLNNDKTKGTRVVGDFEDMPIKNISIKENYSYITLNINNIQVSKILDILIKCNIVYEMFTKITTDKNCYVSFAVPKEKFYFIKEKLENLNIKDIFKCENATKISVIGIGLMTHTNLNKIFDCLEQINVLPKNLTVNEICVSFIVKNEQKNIVIEKLSKEFDL